MIGLTHAQRRVLNFVRAYFGQNGFSPTFAEMRTGCWFSSNQRVFECLNALQERGYLQRDYNRARSIELNDPPILIHGEPYRFTPIAPIPSHGIPSWRLPKAA